MTITRVAATMKTPQATSMKPRVQNFGETSTITNAAKKPTEKAVCPLGKDKLLATGSKITEKSSGFGRGRATKGFTSAAPNQLLKANEMK